MKAVVKKYDWKKITTIEQVYEKHPAKVNIKRIVKALSFLPEYLRNGMLATLNAEVMTDVINNNDPAVPAFIANYNDEVRKYGPWCYGGDESGSGFRFDVSYWTNTATYARGGARLALRDQPRLDHCKKYFPGIYMAFFLKLKVAVALAKRKAPVKSKAPVKKVVKKK